MNGATPDLGQSMPVTFLFAKKNLSIPNSVHTKLGGTLEI